MIGYYIHHVGSGHLARAAAIAAQLSEPVTGLSSLARPAGWIGDWVRLARDDGAVADVAEAAGAEVAGAGVAGAEVAGAEAAGAEAAGADVAGAEAAGADVAGADVAGAEAPDAAGRLHWVPVGDAGLRDRMAQVSQWIAETAPSVLVSDVSVEIALLARLHGVAVVTIALPGRRDDEAHRLGFAVSSVLLSAWPPEATGMLTGLDDAAAQKHVAVGAISRFVPERGAGAREPEPAAERELKHEHEHEHEPESERQPLGSTRARRVLVLNGSGGDDLTADAVARARAQTPGWHWDVIGGGTGRWCDDPWPLILAADVVVSHAGQNAVAEIAAARRPAVIVPQARPHDEQQHTAAVLAGGPWPAVVVDSFATADWPRALTEAQRLDGRDWAPWNDGQGAARAAAAIANVAARRGLPA
ncbi:glycosyltransferase [Herbiconiux daphne]|uniref:Glycosyl transferase family 28 C-terminal domain-containing protein n=1 Tax=Herbiconiux daphne TaxID=2970914 RepID=A0ABT2H5J2_9MICO|nr:glycosyltransferase [Herbiconiux daphne]MCS5735217.1 hypothetical protein [Herbiconiux daphne]